MKYAELYRAKQAAGGYLHSWRIFKWELAKQGVDITDRVDSDYDNIDLEARLNLREPFQLLEQEFRAYFT